MDGDAATALRIEPHHLRRSQLSDLARSEIDELWRRRWGGHTAGVGVAERRYVLDDKKLRPLVAIVRSIEADIAAELPGGLVIPTVVRCTTGQQSALTRRAAQIDDVLITCGLLLVGEDPADPLLTAAEIALELGCEVPTARGYLADGTLPSVVLAERARGKQRAARLSDVEAYRTATLARVTIAQIAAEVGRSPRIVSDHIRRLGAVTERVGHIAMVDAEGVAAIVDHFRRNDALLARAMTISEAAELLQRPLRVVHSLIVSGQLVEDDQLHRYRTVRRDSVAQMMTTRSARPLLWS